MGGQMDPRAAVSPRLSRGPFGDYSTLLKVDSSPRNGTTIVPVFRRDGQILIGTERAVPTDL